MTKPRVVLGVDTDYPPFTGLAGLELGGLAVDFVELLNRYCDVDVELTEVDWEQCAYELPPAYTVQNYPALARAGSLKNAANFAKEKYGRAIRRGILHGCMTYTNVISDFLTFCFRFENAGTAKNDLGRFNKNRRCRVPTKAPAVFPSFSSHNNS